MASWSRVRWSTVCLTSDNSCRIWADEVDGGAGGRSVVTSADVMSHACSRPKFGSIGGRGGDSWLIQGISPRATALSASACHWAARSEEHTSELQSRLHLVCRLLLEKKKKE